MTGVPVVNSVSASPRHRFSKQPHDVIELEQGTGVVGDSHQGTTVQHLSRKRRTPNAPNLRQVHLIQAELLEELRSAGFTVAPGDLGENVLTRGLDLLALPVGTRLRLGAQTVLELTGLRNPCLQLDRFEQGLTAAVLDRDAEGNVIRKAGVMAVVLVGGTVRPGDVIEVELPPGAPRPLEPV